MYLLICRTSNSKPQDDNIIGTFDNLTVAMDALSKECKEKKEYLLFQGDELAIFQRDQERWTIEIWSKSVYYDR
jgi:hypothetical protein